ncbi:MAG: mechanosensitive ion channel family protein [Gammaproteobacteria bacterium]|nr:mechanosensitive ion channel family protein [Gammaproteobacteria bacterium]
MLSAQSADAAPAPQGQPTIEVTAELDALLGEIALQNNDLRQLEERLQENQGVAAKILRERLDRMLTSMYQNIVLLAQRVAAEQERGSDVSAYRDQLIEKLSALPDDARAAMQRVRDRVVFPSSELSPEEFVVADQKLVRQQENLDRIYLALFTYIEIAGEFDQDVEPERLYLVNALIESAANRSAFLELALADAETLQPAVATLPENANLASWLRAAEARVELSADGLQEMITLLDQLGLETRQYRQQVLQVTGEITTDVLDVGIVSSLLAEWGRSIADLIAQDGLQLVFQLLLVALVVAIAYQLANLGQKLVNRGLDSSRVNISNLLRQMIVSMVRNLIIIFGVLIAISQLGISLGPLLAGLGIAGFIIGFALQDTLGNFASGLLILFYRPFDVGDVVEAGGVQGQVSHMSLVNTTFMTFDNQRLVVPNSKIWGSVIKNVTAQTTRRIDMEFSVSYADDLQKVERVLSDVLNTHATVLDDPPPMIKVHELGDSSVKFIVRPWVNTSDYWDTYWDITRAVKMRFDEEGISIPRPQRDVHVIEAPQN